MRKVYYIYNPKTRTYDRIYPTVRQRALSILRRLFVGMGLGAGSFIILLLIFGSPSEKELRIENTRLLAQYNVLYRMQSVRPVMGGQTAMNSCGIWRMPIWLSIPLRSWIC